MLLLLLDIWMLLFWMSLNLLLRLTGGNIRLSEVSLLLGLLGLLRLHEAPGGGGWTIAVVGVVVAAEVAAAVAVVVAEPRAQTQQHTASSTRAPAIGPSLAFCSGICSADDMRTLFELSTRRPQSRSSWPLIGLFFDKKFPPLPHSRSLFLSLVSCSLSKLLLPTVSLLTEQTPMLLAHCRHRQQ